MTEIFNIMERSDFVIFVKFKEKSKEDTHCYIMIWGDSAQAHFSNNMYVGDLFP